MPDASIKSFIVLAVLLFGFAALGVSQESPSAQPVLSIWDQLEIAENNVAYFKSNGVDEYPLNDGSTMGTSSDLFRIGLKLHEQIEELKQPDSQFTEAVIDWQKPFKNRNTRAPYAIQNFFAIQSALPDVDCAWLFATFYLCQAKKAIPDIETALEYALIFVGKDDDALETNYFLTSFIAATGDKSSQSLPPEKRQCHWPAANLILSNPDQSIPLLIDAVKNRRMDEHLRLRAAAFLYQLSPKALGKAAADLETDIARQILCIRMHSISWKKVRPGICERMEISRYRSELFRIERSPIKR
ncbi:MAG: hypothetical protein GC154_10000 [bacterium]|nr:hypothetical protein [bacterium]